MGFNSPFKGLITVQLSPTLSVKNNYTNMTQAEGASNVCSSSVCVLTCAPLTTAWNPEPQSLFIPRAGRSMGMPARSAECLGIIAPSDDVNCHRKFIKHMSYPNNTTENLILFILYIVSTVINVYQHMHINMYQHMHINVYQHTHINVYQHMHINV
jgi:hypothetical protein